MVKHHVHIIVAAALLLLLACSGSAYAWQWHGFVDARSGMRLHEDDGASGQRRAILNELRAQFDVSHSDDLAVWQLRSDFIYDEAAGHHHFDLNSGHGVIDLREANVLFFPHELVDVKLGRQILTWGSGDLLFINDMFPKDWQSFFIGRDEEYLKAPSDAVFISMFPDFASIDVAYIPRFDADRYISGERISYWNPSLARHAGRDDELKVERRSRWFRDDEISLRLYRDVAGYELAVYGYDGFWKSPQGYDPVSARQIFPALRVFGASVRGNVATGLFNVEVGYYDSCSDRDGDDPLIPNSEYRLLIGYEQELMRNLSATLQYYLEYMDDYADYRRTLPTGSVDRDRDRHVVTLRLSRQAFNQNLLLSLFTYWSPSDHDGYIRPSLKYKASDAVSVYVGANLFFGQRSDTFFGQFDKNNNVYVGIRYSL